MSSSAISAAKRRTEAALKNYKIPTSSERTEAQDTPNQVLLSLLQSRLNWSNNVFIKYRSDPEQQPKRNNSVRRRFPMMRELGQATLELGPHLFYETTFYEAIRVESWLVLGKAAGINGIEAYLPPPPPPPPPLNNTTTQVPVNMIDNPAQDGIVDNSTDPPSTTLDNSNVAKDIKPQPSSGQIEHCLVYKDIVLEFKDQPNERYIFPKDVIMQVMEESMAKCSFMLPLDPTCADYFFWDANKKVQHFGDQSSIPEIQQAATQTNTTLSSSSPSSSSSSSFQPINIRVLDACPVILNTMRAILHPPEVVKSKMIKQMEKVPDRLYLNYAISKSEQSTIHGLVQRVNTQPDIISGPIAAEKKRNEIGLAIKLGKRPETDQHEAEPPKTKQFIPGKEDTYRKCAYCSTRHTVMWRRGPLGEGTLCNGCGILWLQNKILIDAPVISEKAEWERNSEKWQIQNRKREREEWEENRRRIKELEALEIKEEQEAAQRMEVCLRIKKRRSALSELPQQQPQQQLPPQQLPPPPHQHQHHHQYLSLNGHPYPTHVDMSYHHQQQAAHTETALTHALTSVVLPSTTPTIKPKGTPPQPPASAPPPPPSSSASASSEQVPPYHIFNLPQIPLPTLCIEFTHTMFSHPNCTVSLSHQKQVCVQLTQDTESITFDIPKHVLAAAVKFDILGQLDSAGRDILLMSCVPKDIGLGVDVPLEGFGSTLYDPADPNRRLNIRFLEKIDALGGPVVKKILECWLADN